MLDQYQRAVLREAEKAVILVSTLDRSHSLEEWYVKIGWAFGRVGQEITIDPGSAEMRQEVIDLAAMCLAMIAHIDNDTVVCDNTPTSTPAHGPYPSLRLVR
jgi:hypothetical protein